MMLTRKQFEEAAKAGARDSHIGSILIRATGKVWNTISFPYSNTLLTDELKAGAIQVLDGILQDYGFEDPQSDFNFNVNKTKKTYRLKKYYTEYFGDDLYLTMKSNGIPDDLYYTQESLPKAMEILDRWLTYVVPLIEVVKNDTRFVSLLLQDNQGRFSEVTIPLGAKLNIDITKNYLPDLPDATIKEKIQEDRGGIMIFNGCPGTGKSTYIKYLMETLPNVDFVVLDPNTIQNFGEDFKNYLIQNSLNKNYGLVEACEDEEPEDVCEEIGGSTALKEEDTCCGQLVRASKASEFSGKVYILEDAEKLLLKRNETTNPVNLSNILNITDGIVGDLVKAKFICTFNCDLSEIDSALLRKGRLLQKYEFKPLTGETLEGLAKELGLPGDHPKEMTLADIYGYADQTGLTDQEKHKIGF